MSVIRQDSMESRQVTCESCALHTFFSYALECSFENEPSETTASDLVFSPLRCIQNSRRFSFSKNLGNGGANPLGTSNSVYILTWFQYLELGSGRGSQSEPIRLVKDRLIFIFV
jgi:hypothetical protein